MFVVLARAVPPVMDAAQVPEEIPGRRFARYVELDVTFILTHLLQASLDQDFVLLLFVAVQNHLDAVFLLLDGDFRDGRNRHAPLLLAEFDWPAGLAFTEGRLGVEQEHHGNGEKSRLVLAPIIRLNQEAMVLHGVVRFQLKAILKEALPAHRQELLDQVRQYKVALVGFAGHLYEGHLRGVVHIFVVDLQFERPLRAVELLDEFEVHQLELMLLFAEVHDLIELQVFNLLLLDVTGDQVVFLLWLCLDGKQVYAATRQADFLLDF